MKFYLHIALVLFLISCSDEEKKGIVEIETSIDESEIVKPEIVDTISKPGETVEYHPNGAVKIRGKLNEMGQREGLWISYYDNGVKWSESYYVNGILDGHSLTFFPNGKVRYVGEYKNGEKSGTWKFYDELGEFVKEENF
ncbi:MAG: hypothetical protein R2780_00080 [Crocinitomicaceae bacterium]|nr:hypothetical protein [Crocinitomicaceae bacterium]